MDTWDQAIAEETLREWQGIVDLVVRLSGARVGLIMRVRDEDIEVLVSSNTPGNPYQVGDRERLLGSGLYCERVVTTGRSSSFPTR